MRGSPPPGSRSTRETRESKSAAVRAAAAAPSRRQLSKWEREQRQQRLLYLGGGVLLLVVVLIFGGGLLYDNVLRANESVAQVASENITAGQLLDEVKPAARAIDSQAKQVGAGASASSLNQYVENQKRQLPDQAMNNLLDATIIQHEASRRGVSVSPAEIDDRMQQVAATYQSATNATPAPTPEASPTDGAGSGTPTPLPTLPPAEYQAALQKFLDQTGLTEQDERKQVARSMLREKVLDAVGEEQVPASPDVPADQLSTQRQQAANTWLSQQRAAPDVKLTFSPSQRDWILSKIGVRP